LGAILLNAGTALEQVRSSPPELEELDHILNDIQADSSRASAIISSIRELSKRTHDRRMPTRVEDVVRLILRLLQHELLSNDVSVVTEFQDGIPDTLLDATQLQQVLLNLVKNAIETMGSVAPQRRRLRLTTSYDGGSTLLLRIQDSGLGIPLENRGRIFDPFFTTKSDGMGLGLAICATAMENLGGKLRLNKSDSNGSIFEIAIPVSNRGPTEQLAT
jgi:C4-dicarboxylate-specific signal transduction histidine kinase